ncbi:MAG TPA: prepilin-type N-terminal cleavage/methylation domain-containing protein [Patescibacteria group bacterium]|nr:prepilin-type N-terminal cleavage/methylation domain-containing protein [Patescibacteria group bacterium]
MRRVFFRQQAGFTLIELLVVMSVIAVISTISIASFVSYSQKATVNQAATDVAALLTDAKSRTQSQVKPSSCNGTLDGYRVDVCGFHQSSCSPNTANTYTLSVVCSGTKSLLVTRTLPANTSFVQSGTTAFSYQFQVLSNGVNNSGTIQVTGFSLTQNVQIGQSASITVH